MHKHVALFLLFLILASACRRDANVDICYAQYFSDKALIFSSLHGFCASVTWYNLEAGDVISRVSLCSKNSSLATDILGDMAKYNVALWRSGEVSGNVSDKNVSDKKEVVKDDILCNGLFYIPSEKIKFAVIGDTSYKTGYLKKLINIILDFSPHIVFHVGDFQYDVHRDRWDNLLTYFSPLFSNVFFHIVAGNHEYDSDEDVRIFRKYFPHEGTFAFIWKDVLFLGVNRFIPGWEDFVIQSMEMRGWKKLIVFAHKPFISLSRWEELTFMDRELFDFVWEKISVLFAGHDHVYGRVLIEGKVDDNFRILQVISGGGGARIYGCTAENYGEVEEFSIKAENCLADYNVVLCETDGDIMLCSAYSPTRGIIDEFSWKIEQKRF